MLRVRVLSAVLVLLGLCIHAGRCETIGGLKASPPRVTAMLVTVSGVVTCVEPQECYIEAADRSGGILVRGDTTGIIIGNTVEARGSYSIVGGEPAIIGATITLQSGSTEIRPFGMSNKTLAGSPSSPYPGAWDYVRVRLPDGSWEWRWVRMAGASNTGLLVTTWGTVKAIYKSPSTGTRWLYVDDGSATVSDLGDKGVLVYTTAEVSQGDFMSVTGISSVEPSFDDPSRLVRVIRTRGPEDVSVLRPRPVPERPFSDEFDKPKLDTCWAVAADTATGGSYSLTEEPGWLTLVAATTRVSWPETVYYRTQAIQLAEGDWDLEVKVRLFHTEGEEVGQGFGMLLTVTVPYRWQRYPYPPEEPVLLAGAYYSHIGGSEPPYRWARAGLYPIHCGQDNVVPRDTDTCFFRVSKRGKTIHAYYSPDGLDYSVEGTSTTNQDYRFFVAYVYTSGIMAPFAAAIDYIRFTPVAQ